MNGPARPSRRARTIGALVTLAALGLPAACSTSTSASPAGVPAAERSPASATNGSSAAATPIPQARQGTPAKSSRVRFEPQSLSLPGGAQARVLPAQTVHGELKVPERVRHVGWWDGSSYAGDPFGTTVIAGHVDSVTDGVGFFARLTKIKAGDRVTLHGDGHRATYRIVSARLVAQRALSADSRAFDQTGDHRLVLITCGGRYDRSRGGYDSNLVVTGVPVGLAR